MTQKRITQAITLAKSLGATAAEASVSVSKGFSLQVRMGEIETLEYHHDKHLNVTVYHNHSQGSISTTDLRPEAIEEGVAKALQIAKLTEADPLAGLPDKELLASDYPDLDLSHPWDITPETATELALECETRARKADKRISNSEGVSFSTQKTDYVYGNSLGFIGSFPNTSHQLSCALVASGKGDMQRDSSYTVARDPSDLWTINRLADEAVAHTLQRLNPRSLSTQQAPIIFSKEVASGLLGHFIAAIRGGALYRKASFLTDQLGAKIFPDWINISENPHLLKGLGSAPFDSDGVKTVAKNFIEQGRLVNYALGTYSARKLNMKNTGNSGGVHNLTISSNAEDLNALIKQMDKGLVVTELMGQGINIITGDYSRGASGFWVENGVIQHPVHQITIAGNLRDIFTRILAVGNDIDTRGNIHSGSILIEQMMIAGQ